MKELSFFNDHFYAPGEAQVDIEDRGYQFGDGIYEVTHVYNGKLFAFDRHLARFRRSMREMHIPITYMDEELAAIHNDLIEKSGIKNGAIYFQVTRAVIVEECAKELGLTVIEKTFTPEFAQNADEAFEASTSLEVTPVIKIGGKKIASGTPGEITKKIMASFQGLIKKSCFD